MTDIDAQATLVTEVQATCRKAKTSRSKADLEAARLRMDTQEVRALPKSVRENLSWAYADAVIAVTGGLA